MSSLLSTVIKTQCRVLAADIGGTHSRFAEFYVNADYKLTPISNFQCFTAHQEIDCFSQLLEKFLTERSTSFSALGDLAAITLAVAGPVNDKHCRPPNIAWDIDLSGLAEWENAELINDFTAQGYACLLQETRDSLVPVGNAKQNKKKKGGRSAVIGAGTGLGHCLLIEDTAIPRVVPSEAGHTNFACIGTEENEYAAFLKAELSIDYLVNDAIVSGPGLQRLHFFLTNERKSAEEIMSTQPKQTLQWFSRFYGRVCRNYCLTQTINSHLIISGGLAAKYPTLIDCNDFLDEFYRGPNDMYRKWLTHISILLNRDEAIGLQGAAYHAALTSVA